MPHNTYMHKVSPVAKAITELARGKVVFDGRRYIKPDGTLNATVLADAMEAAGLKLTQPTIHRILKGDPDKEPAVTANTVNLLKSFFGVPEAVIRGEVPPDQGPKKLSIEAQHLAQSFDEMPSTIRQFLTDVRDAWVRLKSGDPFLAEEVLSESKSA